jgi:hypothetical protein
MCAAFPPTPGPPSTSLNRRCTRQNKVPLTAVEGEIICDGFDYHTLPSPRVVPGDVTRAVPITSRCWAWQSGFVEQQVLDSIFPFFSIFIVAPDMLPCIFASLAPT